MINAQRAVDMRTLVSPAQIMLNDTKYFNGIHTITINNLEAVPVTYTLSNMNARAVSTYNNVSFRQTISEHHAQANGGRTFPQGASNDVLVSTSPNTIDLPPATVTFSQNGFTIPAGGKIEVTAFFNQPRLLWPQRDLFALYSGYVRIDAQLQGASSPQPYTSES